MADIRANKFNTCNFCRKKLLSLFTAVKTFQITQASSYYLQFYLFYVQWDVQ